jgi:hypothetical protein
MVVAMPRAPLALLLALLLAGGAPTLAPPEARAEDGAGGGEDGARSEQVRLEQIKQIARQLRKRARSPRAAQHVEEVLKLLESLKLLGGVEAADAALDATPLPDARVRDAAFALVDGSHDPKLVAPLLALLEDRKNRRDHDLKRRIAGSLAVIADPKAVLPLAGLIRTDEDAEVVATAADALATFGSAPLADRKEAVERLVAVYTSTWNMMMSIRPEDRVIASVMEERWQVYHRAVQNALLALTGAEGVSRPQEWTRWWNDHKKRQDW